MAEERFPVYRNEQLIGSWTFEEIRRDFEAGTLAPADMVVWGERRLPVVRFEKLYVSRGRAVAMTAIVLPILALALVGVVLLIAFLFRGSAGGVGRILENLGF